MFVFIKIRKKQTTTFLNFFKLSNNRHSCNARRTDITKPAARTTDCDLNSTKYKSIKNRLDFKKSNLKKPK